MAVKAKTRCYGVKNGIMCHLPADADAKVAKENKSYESVFGGIQESFSEDPQNVSVDIMVAPSVALLQRKFCTGEVNPSRNHILWTLSEFARFMGTVSYTHLTLPTIYSV